jgi:hypothetical protein
MLVHTDYLWFNTKKQQEREQVFYAELDGRRRKRVVAKVIRI